MMKPTSRFPVQLTCLLLVILTAGLLLPSTPAAAREVPFPAKHTVDGAFDGAASVYAADVDEDGDLDILGAAIDDNAITWWENRGGADTFTVTHFITTTFAGATAVTAADLDGDGDLDVLGAASTDNAITWWENRGGTDTFTVTHSVTTTFAGAMAVTAADLDGDGDLDVLGAASADNAITWWENRGGTDTFTATHSITTTFAGATAVAVADLDGDGDMDVLGAASTDNAITWWENRGGTDTFTVTHSITTTFVGATAVAVADLDVDGDLDVLGAANVDNAIIWWENRGGTDTFTVTHSITTTFAGAAAVAAADLDADGDPDVLGAASTDNTVAWWENTNGSGTSWTERTVDAAFGGAASAHAADVDGDGDLDVLGAASVDDDITWWENETIHRSAVYPVEHTVDGNFLDAHCVYAADVDGDGDVDVLGAAYSTPEDFTWWENTAGDGTAWDDHLIYEEFSWAWEVRAADMDGDGDIDVLGTTYQDDDYIWWENTGPCTGADGACTNWIEHLIDGEADGAQGVYPVDVDGDGDMDVVGAVTRANDITWWENTAGDGTAWTEHLIDGSFSGAWGVHAADVDGDGDIDVLGASWGGAGAITWWENTNGGGTSWSEHEIDGSFEQAQSVYTADLDGDGDADVLGAARAEGDIIWWENTGPCTGTGGACTNWEEHPVDEGFDGAYASYAADVDGDGDVDVLGASRDGNDVTWWENDGTGDGWIEHPVDEAFTGAQSVYTADVDGDGDADILSAARGVDDIAWWENRGGQFALATTDTAPMHILPGQLDDMLQITMTHLGRSGDADEELATLDLLFEESAGDPLTTAEANAIIENLHVYLDDGSGAFESITDTLVVTVTELSLSAGRQTVAFTDGDPNVQVTYGISQTYFVVPKMTTDADQQTPNQFRVTHVTEESSTAENRDHDLLLSLEYAVNTASGITSATNDPPTADAGAGEPYTGTEGSPITFDASDSFDPEGAPLTYEWDWEDDGNYDVTTTSVTITHTWADDGIYTVTLRVTDSGSLTDTDTVTATVTDTNPTADFTAGPTSGVEPLTVVFTDTSVSNDGITAWEWDLGDGSPVTTTQHPTHQYAQDGVYTVTLTVWEGDSDSDTETKMGYVSVGDVGPTADFTADPTSGDEPLTVVFTDTSASHDGITAWSWDLDGDGSTDAT
ncbi:MAG: FG-GAP-like repeat-containing protein, partial [Chloroflexota bacterium]|nr:FG-GAP-like repeat-containing protein [Chloroflexota bacterium]